MNEPESLPSSVKGLTTGLGIVGAVAVVVSLALEAPLWVTIVLIAAPGVVLGLLILIAVLSTRHRDSHHSS